MAAAQARTAKAKARKAAYSPPPKPTTPSDADSIRVMDDKLAYLVRDGKIDKRVDRLVASIAKLKSADAKLAKASGRRGSNSSHNNSYSSVAAPRGLTTQAPAQPMGSTTGGVPGPLKESILPGPTGVGAPGGGAGQAGGGGVNTPITPMAFPEPMVEKEPAVVPEPTPVVGPVPCPGPGWVKVKIGRVWVWGRRNS